MDINYQFLGEELANVGLTGKPVNEYTKEEVEFLVCTCLMSCPRKPWVEELREVLLEAKLPAEKFHKFFGNHEPPF